MRPTTQPGDLRQVSAGTQPSWAPFVQRSNSFQTVAQRRGDTAPHEKRSDSSGRPTRHGGRPHQRNTGAVWQRPAQPPTLTHEKVHASSSEVRPNTTSEGVRPRPGATAQRMRNDITGQHTRRSVSGSRGLFPRRVSHATLESFAENSNERPPGSVGTEDSEDPFPLPKASAPNDGQASTATPTSSSIDGRTPPEGFISSSTRHPRRTRAAHRASAVEDVRPGNAGGDTQEVRPHTSGHPTRPDALGSFAAPLKRVTSARHTALRRAVMDGSNGSLGSGSDDTLLVSKNDLPCHQAAIEEERESFRIRMDTVWAENAAIGDANARLKSDIALQKARNQQLTQQVQALQDDVATERQSKERLARQHEALRKEFDEMASVLAEKEAWIQAHECKRPPVRDSELLRALKHAETFIAQLESSGRGDRSGGGSALPASVRYKRFLEDVY